MSEIERRIEANPQRLRSEPAEAAERGGRPADAVRMVAVTKAVGFDELAALVGLGQADLGENRAEQLTDRAEAAAGRELGVTWHMVGHRQRRKVRDLLPAVGMIHSVDSDRLAAEIDKRAAAAGLPPVPVLLEVNVAGEGQKFGFRPEEVQPALRRAADMASVSVRGLMAMAPLVDDPEKVRPVFRRLRELRDRANDAGAYPEPLAELSMGMSQDYRVAAEEGATLVRIGTALFA